MGHKQLIASLLLTVASALLASASFAAQSSTTAAVTSNYVVRGQTQTEDGLAIQGSYNIQHAKNSGWYAGVFASTVRKGIEIDLYGGWKGEFGERNIMGYDVGVITYKYTDSGFSGDVTEYFAGISYETAYVKLFMGNGSGSSYNYLDIGASYVVLNDLDLDVHFGRSLSSAGGNDLSASLGTQVKGYDLSLGLTYEDTSPDTDIEFFVTVAIKFD